MRLEKLTPKGSLRIEPHDDPSFPGFTLYLEDQQVGVFEYDSVADVIRLHGWTNDAENPTVSLTVEHSA